MLWYLSAMLTFMRVRVVGSSWSSQSLGVSLFLLGLPPLPLFFLKVIIIRTLFSRTSFLELIILLLALTFGIVTYFAVFVLLLLGPLRLMSSSPAYSLLGLGTVGLL